MVKKILIGVGIFAVIATAGYFFLMNRNRTMSPPGSAALTKGDLTVSVTYSRPSVRGRLIFGTKEQGALQPYGQYWRLGANEATEITLNKDVNFNGSLVKAGTYWVYAIPQESRFEIILNTELPPWGAFEPDHALDLLKTNVPAEKAASSVEQFTISLLPIEGGISVVFEWSDARWSVPVTGL
jgi:hypothetical protein